MKNLSKMKNYTFDNRYLADDKGNVYLMDKTDREKTTGLLSCHKMKPFITRDGYVEYVLTNSHRKKKHIQAHRIVASLYLPTIKNREEVNHKNGNRNDNRRVNLEWVSHKENIQHSFKVLNKKVWNSNK